MIGKDFIFIHINRTGGSSLEFSLREYGYWRNTNFWKGFPSHRKENRGENVLEQIGFFHPQHFNAREYRQVLGGKEYSRRFVFTVVRNPWDRMLSHYSYAHHKPITVKGFNNWILKTFLNPDKYDLPCVRQPYRCKSHRRMIMPCTDWLQGAKVDFIARFENYEEDVREVYSILTNRVEDGLLNLRKVRNKKSSTKFRSKSSYRDYYIDDTKVIIEKNFASDIKTFGYYF